MANITLELFKNDFDSHKFNLFEKGHQSLRLFYPFSNKLNLFVSKSFLNNSRVIFAIIYSIIWLLIIPQPHLL